MDWHAALIHQVENNKPHWRGKKLQLHFCARYPKGPPNRLQLRRVDEQQFEHTRSVSVTLNSIGACRLSTHLRQLRRAELYFGCRGIILEILRYIFFFSHEVTGVGRGKRKGKR